MYPESELGNASANLTTKKHRKKDLYLRYSKTPLCICSGSRRRLTAVRIHHKITFNCYIWQQHFYGGSLWGCVMLVNHTLLILNVCSFSMYELRGEKLQGANFLKNFITCWEKKNVCNCYNSENINTNFFGDCGVTGQQKAGEALTAPSLPTRSEAPGASRAEGKHVLQMHFLHNALISPICAFPGKHGSLFYLQFAPLSRREGAAPGICR